MIDTDFGFEFVFFDYKKALDLFIEFHNEKIMISVWILRILLD